MKRETGAKVSGNRGCLVSRGNNHEEGAAHEEGATGIERCPGPHFIRSQSFLYKQRHENAIYSAEYNVGL